MPVDIGDKYLVTIVGELDAQTTLNTFKYVVTVLTGTPTDLQANQALHDRFVFADKVKDEFLGCVGTNFLLKQLWVQKVFPIRLRKQVYVVNEQGTLEDEQGTANLAAVITRTGGIANKQNLSSLHIPISTGPLAIANGIIQIDLKAAMTALCTQIVVPLVSTAPAITFDPSIWGADPSASPVPIVTAFPQDTVRVMRRRTVGVGI